MCLQANFNNTHRGKIACPSLPSIDQVNATTVGWNNVAFGGFTSFIISCAHIRDYSFHTRTRLALRVNSRSLLPPLFFKQGYVDGIAGVEIN